MVILHMVIVYMVIVDMVIVVILLPLDGGSVRSRVGLQGEVDRQCRLVDEGQDLVCCCHHFTETLHTLLHTDTI